VEGRPLTDSRDPIDLSRFDEPDLEVVDVLARASLEAHRRGEPLICRGTPASLLDFLAFCGLEQVLRFEQVLNELPERDEPG
jgi:hypothetical protein